MVDLEKDYMKPKFIVEIKCCLKEHFEFENEDRAQSLKL